MVGSFRSDPFNASGTLAFCAGLAVAATVKDPEWGDYWTGAIASAHRLALGAAVVEDLADVSAGATLTGLPIDVASQEALVALRKWHAHWGQAALMTKSQRPDLDDRGVATLLAPAIAGLALSAARMDTDWAMTWAAVFSKGSEMPGAPFDELVASVISQLSD